MSLGFSASDFVVAAQLVETVIVGLSGCGDEFQDLIAELQAYQGFLLYLEQLDLGESRREDVIRLQTTALQQQQLIREFWRMYQKDVAFLSELRKKWSSILRRPMVKAAAFALREAIAGQNRTLRLLIASQFKQNSVTLNSERDRPLDVVLQTQGQDRIPLADESVRLDLIRISDSGQFRIRRSYFDVPRLGSKLTCLKNIYPKTAFQFGGCWLIALIFTTFLSLSLFLGLYFTIERDYYRYSMGDSFTLAGYVFAVGSFISAVLSAYHYPRCSCWKGAGRDVEMSSLGVPID